MRYFYKYKCTQLVLDTNGIGLGVYDFICKDQYDSETGEEIQTVNPGKLGQTVKLLIPFEVKKGWILRRKKYLQRI